MSVMGRNLRFIPPGSLVEVTCRTIQGRLLLRPSRDLNEIVLGILGRAARLYRVGVVHFVYLSNHAHLLLVPEDAEQLALFMNYVNGNLAREAGRLHSWRARFWSRRYRAIVVSDEEEAQTARLRYLLTQGCKEGLVRNPRDWPGATAIENLLDGNPVRGLWFDRTAESKARRKGRPDKYDHATTESFELTQLPTWKHMPDDQRRARIAEMVSDIEAETRARLVATGRSPMGRRRIEGANPHDLPADPSRSSAPRFHAVSPTVRNQLVEAYRRFEEAFRQAAEQLRHGLPHRFPAGSFPPHLPFQLHPDRRPPPA